MTSERSHANRGEGRGTGALELCQTRNLTPTELRAIERDWSRLLRNSMDGDGWYGVLAYLTYGFIGFLVLSIAKSVAAIDTEHSHLPVQLAVALAGTIACWTAAEYRARNMQRRIFWDRYREGDRYLLGEHSVQIISTTARHELFWDSITDMADNGQRLVLLLSKSGALFLVHGAFAGQDVEGFWAELVRRWQTNQKAAQPEPST
jgi:hypothetical protein